jgi:hypothetical protein
VIVLNLAREAVTQFQTDVEGRFEVPLPPGEYILQPQSPGRYPVASELNVTVLAGQYTEVTIHYDSGMR